jgi:biotin carboxylase
MKVLVINIGWEQQPLIESLYKKGHELYGIASNRDIETPQLFKKIIIEDVRNLENILNFAEEIKPEAVISDQCDYSHFAQAFISEKLGLNGPSILNAQISANKLIQRELAKKNGVKIPDFKAITNLNDAIDASTQIGFPVIVKPTDNRGSFGVTKANNIEELKEAFYLAIQNSHSRIVIIEKFISGYEITVDGYCFNGVPKSLAIALKSKEGLTSQVSMDIKYPADIPEDVYNKALENNEFVAKSLGYKFGMTHAEYLVNNDNEIYLVECANRGGGVFTSELIVPSVCGINILECYINDALGISSTQLLPDRIERNQVLLKFFSFENGIVESISDLEDLKMEEGVIALRLKIKVGDTITSIENDGSRHGFIIFKSSGNLREEAKNIIKKIKIKYKHG